MAPDGGEALYVLVHTPYLRPHHDWRSGDLYPRYRQTILDKLKRSAGLHDIEERIVVERQLTPHDIHERYRVLNGAIYGLASHGRMMGAFKPGNRSREVGNLYLAGGAAHPGPGMPMVMMSGWIAADAMDADAISARRARRPSLHRPTGPGRGAVIRIATRAERAGRQAERAVARYSPALARFFTFIFARDLARSFQAVRLLGPLPALGDAPVVCVVNHPSWWDAALFIWLPGALFNRRCFAPMDAAMLARYPFFERIGAFGVQAGSVGGAATFLVAGERVLAEPDALLLVNAQGHFSDVRARPVVISARPRPSRQARAGGGLPAARLRIHLLGRAPAQRPDALRRTGAGRRPGRPHRRRRQPAAGVVA